MHKLLGIVLENLSRIAVKRIFLWGLKHGVYAGAFMWHHGVHETTRTFLLPSFCLWTSYLSHSDCLVVNLKFYKTSSTVDFGWFVAFESIIIFRVEFDWNCNFVGLLHHPFGFSLLKLFWVITVQHFEFHCLAKDHWWGFSTRYAHMVHIKHYRMTFLSALDITMMRWIALDTNLFCQKLFNSDIIFKLTRVNLFTMKIWHVFSITSELPYGPFICDAAHIIVFIAWQV